MTPWWSDTLGSDLNAYLGCLSANKKTIFLDQELKKKKKFPNPLCTNLFLMRQIQMSTATAGPMAELAAQGLGKDHGDRNPPHTH